MNDERITDEPEVEEQEAPVEEQAPKPAPPPELPSFEGLASGKEPWKGGGCSSRLPLYGCVISLAVVVAFLMAGTSMVRRTVWSNFDGARRAISVSLPTEMSQSETARTRRNLDRFRAVLERIDDPYPLMGEFVTRARSMLGDGRLTVEEVEALNLVLERWIEDSGIPPLQLESRFRNSDFEVRISRPPLRSAGSLAENPKSETRNPKSPSA